MMFRRKSSVPVRATFRLQEKLCIPVLLSLSESFKEADEWLR